MTVVLPMLYRRCPMGNAHSRSDDLCNCCAENEFVWSDGKWVLLKYAQVKNNGGHSGLSWSGRLSSSDLWLSALKQGLVLALILGSIMAIGLWQIKNAADKMVESKKTNVKQAE